jgi:hypothetical protein
MRAIVFEAAALKQLIIRRAANQLRPSVPVVRRRCNWSVMVSVSSMPSRTVSLRLWRTRISL